MTDEDIVSVFKQAGVSEPRVAHTTDGKISVSAVAKGEAYTIADQADRFIANCDGLAIKLRRALVDAELGRAETLAEKFARDVAEGRVAGSFAGMSYDDALKLASAFTKGE